MVGGGSHWPGHECDCVCPSEERRSTLIVWGQRGSVVNTQQEIQSSHSRVAESYGTPLPVASAIPPTFSFHLNPHLFQGGCQAHKL